MKKAIKIVFVILAIVAVLIVIGTVAIKHVISSLFVPNNLLDIAPNRIVENLSIDLIDPLQRQVTAAVVLGMDAETENVKIYRGIPYAAPPVVELSWQVAQNVSTCNGF